MKTKSGQSVTASLIAIDDEMESHALGAWSLLATTITSLVSYVLIHRRRREKAMLEAAKPVEIERIRASTASEDTLLTRLSTVEGRLDSQSLRIADLLTQIADLRVQLAEERAITSTLRSRINELETELERERAKAQRALDTMMQALTADIDLAKTRSRTGR